eukprot:m.10779 g.10779  ORF g.10779 m.10779 type:complete len:516 (-) comp5617_c0_seq1:1260-2807(-)
MAFNLSEDVYAGDETQQPTIRCVDCGTVIVSNPTALCTNCIRAKVDITEGIPKQATLFHCKGCDRYLSPPATFVSAELESRELLALCLKRLKGLSKVRLVDAGFIWTEPHSRRIKVKLTIQKEVFSGSILQQTFIVEYVVGNQFCPDCHRLEASDTWNAVVQVRQKVRHKKTFMHLEQLIIKHNAHKDTVKISRTPDGVDFYYSSKNDGKRMVDFLHAVAPVRYKTSERLISQDLQSNVYNYKYTFSVEIIPICKDDVVCLSPQIRKKNGGFNPIAVCYRVGNSIHVIDPTTLNCAEVTAPTFWRNPFGTLCGHGHYTEFTVLDKEEIYDAAGNPVVFGKYRLVDLYIARERDLGVNDQQFIVRTHLGNILEVGDNAWGYDMTVANFNDEHANALDQDSLPDVVLVKKSYSHRAPKRRTRKWKLKQLAVEEGLLRKDQEDMIDRDREAFLNDIEEDAEYRANFMLYKNDDYQGVTDSEAEDPELHIGEDELLADFASMDLGDDVDEEDEEEGAAM